TAICLLKFEMKDGKPAASPAFTFDNEKITVSDVRVTETGVSLTVTRVRQIQDQDFTEVLHFEGVRVKNPKEILGSIGNNRLRQRVRRRAAARDWPKNPDEIVRSTPLPEPMKKVQELNTQLSQAFTKADQEKDAAKKKELQAAYQELR